MQAPSSRAIALTIAVVLCPVWLWGQVEGPSLGLVLDPEIGRIRPILGIGGAASLGMPLDIGVTVEAVAGSPERDYVLAISGKAEVVLVRNAFGSPSVSGIEGVRDGIDRIVLSPGGSAAALIARGVIQVIAGLPKEPYVAQTVTVPSVFGALTVVAVGDDAGSILTAFSRSGSAYLLGEDGIRPIGVFGRVSAMEFLHNSSDALIADDLYNEVYLVREVSGLPSRRRLADSGSGVSGPVAVRASADNQQFVVANAGSAEILFLDGASSPVEISCPCQPDRLYRLRGNAVFGLTEADGPMWVFVGDRTPARTFVIPPPTTSEDNP